MALTSYSRPNVGGSGIFGRISAGWPGFSPVLGHLFRHVFRFSAWNQLQRPDPGQTKAGNGFSNVEIGGSRLSAPGRTFVDPAASCTAACAVVVLVHSLRGACLRGAQGMIIIISWYIQYIPRPRCDLPPPREGGGGILHKNDAPPRKWWLRTPCKPPQGGGGGGSHGGGKGYFWRGTHMLVWVIIR